MLRASTGVCVSSKPGRDIVVRFVYKAKGDIVNIIDKMGVCDKTKSKALECFI